MLRVTTHNANFFVLIPNDLAWIENDIQPIELVGNNEEWIDFFEQQGFVIESVGNTNDHPELVKFSGCCAQLTMKAKGTT